MDKKLSQILSETFNLEARETNIGELLKSLDHHGIAIMLILFSIPAALPIPAAGYSTILSIPLFLVGFRLLKNQSSIHLPQKISSRKINPSQFAGSISKLLKLTTFLEKFSKPRFEFFTSSKYALPILGLIIILLASSMALPIPGTNTAPAFAIFVIGFGMLEKDGFVVLLGIITSIVAICISLGIIWFGQMAFKAFIKAFL